MKISVLITFAVFLMAVVSAVGAEKGTEKRKGKRRDDGAKERRRQGKNRGYKTDVTGCQDLSPKQKQRKLRGAQKAYEKTAPIRIAEQLKKDDGRRKRNAEMECPETEVKYGDINQRAISPWAWELDVDVNRYPTEIAKAKCLCDFCLINGQTDYNHVSEPIYTDMKVLRRTRCDRKGRYRYDVVWEKVPVGCTCANPK